ncbi:site-2 protease family protein [Paenibacillus sp. sptzw28]|uniref:site-2 protease family protein n=1 Tax=Paenibacillus sp. sptzw28 TaxID=715179 RepID=UPI0021623399|nr:site-2 protease family protein [Paenibacillus sp. sptzw28]
MKFSKFGSALISMLVTIWAYTILFPIQVAVGLVAMIFIHEMGHVIAAKRKGLPVTAPVFIPFLGALILLKRNPRDAVTEAYIAIGGPLVGTIGAAAAFLIGWGATQAGWSAEWYILIIIAKIGFILNLFNLLPLHPLDGGRIATAVTRWLWVIGVIGGALAIIYLNAWILSIFWVMFVIDLYNKYIRRRGNREKVVVQGSFAVPLQPLLDQGYFIPGEDHRRELPFNTYSTLEGRQRVVVRWEGLGLEGEIELPRQTLIRKVEVIKIVRQLNEEEPKLAIHCEVTGQAHENIAYYDVPPAARVGFGLVYGGLALFLLYMLYLISQMNIPTAF